MIRTRIFCAAAALLPALHAKADVFDDVPEASAYNLVLELDIPAIQGAYNTNPVPYSVNNSGSVSPGSFERVAYYLELGGSTDSTRPNGFVYVSFDRPAVFLDGASLGVPSNGSNGSRIVTNTGVSNMNVVSNISGIVTGANFSGGKLEFWPSHYDAGVNEEYDYDDTAFTNIDGWGSMQIHNTASAQTLIGYSDWGGLAPGEPSEIGAGNNPGLGDPDWTFSNSGTTYTVRRLQVLVKSATNLVPITNPSFETDSIQGEEAPVYEARATAPQGWAYSGPAEQGLIAPDAGEPNPIYQDLTPGYTGSKVHYSFTVDAPGVPTLTQTLETTLKANTSYRLSVQIGNRSNGDVWGGYHIALETESGAIVGEWEGANRNFTVPGTFGTTARRFTTGANPPGLGEVLRVVIKQPAAVADRYLDVDDVALTADPVADRPVGTPIDVFIVSGQSNSHGWQSNAAALSSNNRHYADTPPTDAFLAYKENGLGDPLYNTGSLAQISTQGPGFAGIFDGFGPELSLGKDLASRLPRKLAVVKFSVGAAGLDNHFKKSVNFLYPLLVQQVTSALDQMRAQGFAPELKGFFWLQGETDAGGTGFDQDDSLNYGVNITEFVRDLRVDFIAPSLKFYLTEINPNMPLLLAYPVGVQQVNDGMRNLASSDSNVEFITTSDITEGFADQVHYTADQTIDIGQRWAKAYTPLEDWRQKWFGLDANNTGDAANNADPYHTGIPNLLVFAFFGPDQDPATAMINQLPQATNNTNFFTYQFTVPAGVSDVTYGAAWSGTLQADSWQLVTDTGSETEHIFSVPMDSSKKFLRLTVD
jgi:hypothetical protein